MDSIYTTTITDAAVKRGISVKVIDPVLPIFTLCFGNKQVRCYNGLTDQVGAASFHLAQDKGAANRFLKNNGFSVPHQELYRDFRQAVNFLYSHQSIVVKPVSQWGGKGVSTHIKTDKELRTAIIRAHQCSDEIVLEQCVQGIDWRLIYVDSRFICAIQRNPAVITGDGDSSIKQLIKLANKTAEMIDSSNIIPFDIETKRCIQDQGLTYNSVIGQGLTIPVRRTSNYHTGGSVELVTERIPYKLIQIGEEISSLYGIPVIGIDMLVDLSDNSYHIIELSPDLAISPPEGEIVAEAFLDYLFPESRKSLAGYNKECARTLS